MNRPIIKIGKQGEKTLYFLNGQQTILYPGFTPTAVYFGMHKDPATGEHTHRFAPNRKQRRQVLQTKQNNPGYGKFVRRVQHSVDIILDGRRVKDIRKLSDKELLRITYKEKVIIHTLPN
jgi:hypothetical protein